ncbi:MAG TPA: malic enzyme-like NAD(P)-binding protein [Sedimentibacter sp.]|jgi:malate dehydrogenase (oxaloacetate-decarboxylating)|nr:NAD-dependent malic enzyme [Sedimentibacter sp.]HHZ01126.1 NAD-dependent malic enzyme [Tissierellia bacterium]HOK49935.1 malic enzyme-like NAD(P)-binding protein [Sedimentibacter sp.]HRC81587.1 malic enzyme-like NAD(P)-binding protein [Sedimentibacter sp.]
MTLRDDALKLHKDYKGKLNIMSKVAVNDRNSLSLAYTPGVAEPCKEIHKDENLVYEYTSKGNLVAVVSDGTAVLGLGDIGPYAAIPVMEGKSVLFKEFGGVDSFPICVKTKDPDEIVKIVEMIEPVFGGINLEDISAPRCFEIERKLKEKLSIPVFHDDQHGTAIIVLAGLMNALRLIGKKMEDLIVVINGSGAAGIAIGKIILSVGVKDLIMVDRTGIIYKGREKGMNWIKEEMAEVTNKNMKTGSLADAMVGADVFIGVSEANIVTEEMVKNMNKDPIIFAMANPVPEIDPTLAKKAGARVVGTGRSDYPNQINNVLAFPGLFRGALDVRAKTINEEMKLAAAKALSEIITDEELTEDYIIPLPFDKRVRPAVAKAVAQAAKDSGVARL